MAQIEPTKVRLATCRRTLSLVYVMRERTGLGSDKFFLKALADQTFRALRKRKLVC